VEGRLMVAVVFDLDGTLIDSAPDIHAIGNRVLEQVGAPPITLDETRGFVGGGAAVFVARMRAARDIAESEQTRLLAAFLDLYEGAVDLTRPYPDVPEVLESLRSAGVRLGICTNKPLRPAQMVLRHLRLDGYFDIVIGGDSLPMQKPDPSPLHATFDALRTVTRLYVGDSEVDAETARRAEVPFLLFTEGYRRTPAADLPAVANFGAYADLPGLIDALYSVDLAKRPVPRAAE
jgi:phosphoglycolate phosphatase